MSKIVPEGPDFKSPAAAAIADMEAAIAKIPAYERQDELERRFPNPAFLWLAMMNAGGRFYLRRHSYNDAWDFVPPSGPLTDEEAFALAWGMFALRLQHGGQYGTFTFHGYAVMPYTWSIAYTAEVMGVPAKRVWELVRDGAIGGYEARRGMWQIAPGSVERYQQRQQQKKAA